MRVTIQPYKVSLNKNESGNYYIFASKYIIEFEKDVNTNKLAESLFNERLFDLYKSDIKTKLTSGSEVYVIKCDGNDTLSWLINLLNWCKKNNKLFNTQFRLSKIELKSKGVNDLSSLNGTLNPKMQDMIIESYINAVYKIAVGTKTDDIITTKVKKCESSLRIDTSFDRMYIL